MFKTLLVANRGEIARRVMRTARAMGIKTVAVYSDADAGAPHVRDADEAVRIGPPPAAQSYLKIDAILAAAKETGADAVHPGYGFLSENADFAEACAQAGLIFVGPPPAAIRAMGRKDEAKTAMAKAGVPVTPGYQGDAQGEAKLAEAAGVIGYPVLIKAVAGGGGKGMRKVDDAGAFKDALASAKREAKSAFGDDRVLIEKFIDNPRHIEVQVFGDAHGNVIHLFERDCSLQRRHQKVIEEAPAPGMTKAVRAAMCAAAVTAAKAVDYVGAGTVEFIVDGSGPLKPDGFWFMEMNTRLQVEHPVTEEVTGLDLVALQLRVASGDALPDQSAIKLDGHAIEARLYAEDPANQFLPSTGPVDVLDIPLDVEPPARLRWDGGVEAGGEASAYYDPMIGKAIAWAPDRGAAAAALAGALKAARVAPIRANAGFLARCLEDADFLKGRVDTGLIARRGAALTTADAETAGLRVTLAALARHAARRAMTPASPWDVVDGFRLNAPVSIEERFTLDGAPHWVRLRGKAPLSANWTPVEVIVDGTPAAMEVALGASVALRVAGREEHATWARETLFQRGDALRIGERDLDLFAEGLEAGDEIAAPMPGRVLTVAAKAGAKVKKGATLAVVEAMKMEHALAAPRDGVVAEVRARPGDQVKEGDLLVRLALEG